MVQALIFDVFGTVVDWRSSVAREAKNYFAPKGVDIDYQAFADAWRGQYQPAMERIRSGGRGYIRLDTLHRENLDVVLEDFGLSGQVPLEDRDQLNTAWEKLDPWPDSVAGLTALKKKFIIAPCSNGSIALMTRLARYGGLPWDAIAGAELARDYKPKHEVYLASAEAFNLPPSEVMMVAAHNDDLQEARAAGLKTGFFPRPKEKGPGQTTDLEAAADWDVIAENLLDLSKKMGC